MGGGGGAPKTQEVTTTTSNLPAYAQPYYENLMNRAQAESYRDYTPYGDQRIAGFTPEQQQVQQDTMGLQAPGQLAAATNMTGAAGLGAIAQGQGYDPAQFQAMMVQNPQLQQYFMNPAGTFGQAQADQYMSPYAQNVIDVTKRSNLLDAQKDQLAANLNAARQGTYGGARQTLAMTERERNLGNLQADTQAKGLQAAYENAQQQFERDRKAGFDVGSANLQSALSTQQLGSGQEMSAQAANQTAWLDAQKAAEASRQFGAGQGMKGWEDLLAAGNQMGQLGQTQQSTDLARLQAQMGIGTQEQQQQQQYLDQAYADFLRQRDYPQEQLGYFSNLMRGLPVQLGSTATTYATPPSMASQLAGAGLGALSLSKLAG